MTNNNQPIKTKIILNPNAGQGHGAKVLPEIEHHLHTLNIPFDLVQTTAPHQADQLAAEAVVAGYKRVVAAGGDGTVNEVVNGLMTARTDEHSPILGVLPVGSGNDLAYALGIPTDIAAACARLRDGSPRQIDVGKVTVDGTQRFFDNNVGIGFDGEVVVDLAQGRTLSGFLMYLWSVFRVLFAGHWPLEMSISIDGNRFRQPVTLITVANGVRAGGGFLLTPEAKLDDGLLDICYADGLSKLGVLNLLPRTINGSHIRQKSVSLTTAAAVEISVPDGAPAHIDGEVLCERGREFKFEILANQLTVWA